MLSPELIVILESSASFAVSNGASSVKPEHLLMAMLEDGQIYGYLCRNGLTYSEDPAQLAGDLVERNKPQSYMKSIARVGPDSDHQLILKSAHLGVTKSPESSRLTPLDLLMAFIASAPSHCTQALYKHGFSLPREDESYFKRFTACCIP